MLEGLLTSLRFSEQLEMNVELRGQVTPSEPRFWTKTRTWISARTGGSHPWSILHTAIVLSISAALLAWHEDRYRNFFTDDGFISLRYTQRLLSGHGLTWDDYVPVEGYSNLLWVLLCAIPAAVGVDLVESARGLGFISTLITFGAIIFATRPTKLREGIAPIAGIGLLLATDSIAVWSTGGLEPPLLMALISWAFAFCLRANQAEPKWEILAALLVGLSCWCRPDAPLFGVILALSLFFTRGRAGLRPAAWILGGVALFVGAQLTFRWFYYHDYLPNTAYAKVVLNEHRLEHGIKHFNDSHWPLAATWLALLLAGVHSVFDRRSRRDLLPLVLMAGGWTAYLVRVGGDNFPAWRQMPYLVTFAGFSLALILIRDLRAKDATKTAAQWGLTFVALSWIGTVHDPGNWADRERWQWKGYPVGKALAAAFGDKQPLIAVDAAGAIPLFSRLPALDMLGLNDRYLAHHRPKGMGKDLIGHELGDADYYLRRRPDLFCYGVPPCFHGPRYVAQRQMMEKPAFRENYVAIRLQTRTGKKPLISEFWLNKNGRLGAQKQNGSWTVFGYLFAAPGALTALQDGKLITRLNPRTRASTDLRLEPGSYVAEARDAKGPGTLGVLYPEGSTASQSQGKLNRPLRFEVPRAQAVQLSVATSNETAEFTSLVIRKL